MCRRDHEACRSRNRERTDETAAITEVTADGGLNQIMTIKMVQCGPIDSGYILKVALTGCANDPLCNGRARNQG